MLKWYMLLFLSDSVLTDFCAQSSSKFNRYWGPDGDMSVSQVSPSSGMAEGGEHVTLTLLNQLKTRESYIVTCGDQTAEVVDTQSVISDMTTKVLPFTKLVLIMPPGVAGTAQCIVRSCSSSQP